jgi:hypothetical protein
MPSKIKITQCDFSGKPGSFNTHEGLFSFTLWTKSNSWESCQVAFHNWNSQWSPVSILLDQNINMYIMSSYIGTVFMWNQISACFIFTLPEKLYPFLSALNLDLDLMEPTGTGQENVTCPLGSTVSWSAEFKQRNISANSVHVCGDWQHPKGHWVKGERQSCQLHVSVCFTQFYSAHIFNCIHKWILQLNLTAYWKHFAFGCMSLSHRSLTTPRMYCAMFPLVH